MAVTISLSMAAASCSSGSGGTTTAPPASETTTVNSSPIVIGIALADYAAFARISPRYAVGPVGTEFDSVLTTWQANQENIVQGRPIQFDFQLFNELDDDSALAPCKSFTRQHVFVVLGMPFFTPGAACLASRFHIPVIDVAQPREASSTAQGPTTSPCSPRLAPTTSALSAGSARRAT